MCTYCGPQEAYMFNNRDKLGRKSDRYPGIHVYYDFSDEVLRIGACADTYETSWVEAEFKINFCPMCGRDLRSDGKE